MMGIERAPAYHGYDPEKLERALGDLSETKLPVDQRLHLFDQMQKDSNLTFEDPHAFQVAIESGDTFTVVMQPVSADEDNEQFTLRFKKADSQIISNERDFEAEMEFDFTPDEPELLHGAGGPLQNRHDKIKRMTSTQFRGHLDFMFRTWYRAKMYHNERRPGMKLRWRDTVNRYDFDAFLSEANMNEEYSQFLDRLRDDVFNSNEYQRGIVNYMDVYQKVFQEYFDFIEDMSFQSCSHSPVFYCDSLRARRAPGSYKNGVLARPSSTFTRIPHGRSAYGRYNENRRTGSETDRSKVRANTEAQRVRTAYGKAWRNLAFRRLLRDGSVTSPDDPQVTAAVDAMIEKHLAQRGMLHDYRRQHNSIRFSAPPTAPVNYNAFKYNIDARYRGVVARSLNTHLELGARKTSEVEAKVQVDELEQGDNNTGFAQAMRYSTRGEMYRGKYVTEPKRGLLLLERNDENPEAATTAVLDFAKANDMCEQLLQDDLMAPLLGPLATVFSNEQRAILRKAVTQSNSSRNEQFYLSLSPQELDQFRDVLDHHFPKLQQLIAVMDRVTSLSNIEKIEAIRTWPTAGTAPNADQQKILDALTTNYDSFKDSPMWKQFLLSHAGDNMDGLENLIDTVSP